MDSEELNPKVTISGNVNWDAEHLELRPEEVTVSLKDEAGEEVANCVASAPDWAYSFTVPVYDEEGNVAQYTLSQEEVEYYKTTITPQPVIKVEENVNDDANVALGAKYASNNNKESISYKEDLKIDDKDNAIIVIKLTGETENKGSNLFIWSLRELSEEEQNKLKASAYAYPEIKQKELTFYFNSGLGTFDAPNKAEQKITFEEDFISFSHENIWSMIVPGTSTPNTVTVTATVGDSSIYNNLTSIPWTPIEPGTPVEPEDPTIPWTPIEPSEPVEPEEPTIPWTPIVPAEPIEPDEVLPDIEAPVEDDVLGDVEKPVNTADNSQVALFAMLGLASAAAMVVLRKKESE